MLRRETRHRCPAEALDVHVFTNMSAALLGPGWLWFLRELVCLVIDGWVGGGYRYRKPCLFRGSYPNSVDVADSQQYYFAG